MAVRMQSLFAQYEAERAGNQTLETEEGFATWRYLDTETVYIVDLYVVPERRREGVATRLADRICAEALATGRTRLFGTIDPNAHGAHESLLGLLAYGMRLSHSDGPLLVLTKSLIPEGGV